MSPSPIEMATVIASLAHLNPEQVCDGEPQRAVVAIPRRSDAMPIRRAVGRWLVSLGQAVTGQREALDRLS